MRVLLVSMPDFFPEWSYEFIQAPNLGLASIAANTKHEVFVADLTLKYKNVKKALLKAIKKTKPKIIGLSAMSFQYKTALSIARFLRNNFPDKKIILGGYHATTAYKDIGGEDWKYLDFLVRGEGESSFNELLNYLETNKGNLRDIMGISYKNNNKVIHNKNRANEDLASLKIPKRDVRLWKGYHFFGNRLETVETSRGCLMNCKFCSIRKMYGKTFRKYKLERVIKDLIDVKKRGVKSVFFVDDNITLDIERVKELCRLIIKNKLNNISYSAQVSSFGIAKDRSLSKLMSNAGFDFVFLGIENISDKNLRYLEKGSVLENSKKAIRYLHDNNIAILGGFVLGNPDDKLEDIKKNFEFANENKLEDIMPQILTPYPGTEIRKELLRKRLVTNKDDFKKYNGWYANIKTNYLSSYELELYKWKYTAEFFKNMARRGFQNNLLFKNNIKRGGFVFKFLPKLLFIILKTFLNRKKSDIEIYEDRRKFIMKNNNFI